MQSFRTLVSPAYRASQSARILATAESIDRRSGLGVGRVIPDADDLAIHEGRFLYAAVLFLDISGFTSRPQETMEQQELMLRGLSLFFTEAIRVVEDFGGTVEKNTGDGLMAYFVAEPDEGATKEQRAVAAALTLFHVVNDALSSTLNNALIARAIPPFLFRICIDSGSLTIAKMGAVLRFNGIVAIGTTANLACKMLNVAKAGELMIGNNVREGLPLEWKGLSMVSDHDTGCSYSQTGAPYQYWYYYGRWTS